MSYILEALKKAEAERKAGTQPGAPLLPSIAAPSRQPPPWRRPLPASGFAALAVALACAAWFALTRESALPMPAPVQSEPSVVLVPPAAAPREAMPAVAEAAPRTAAEKTPPNHAAKSKRARQAEEQKTAKAALPPEAQIGTLRDLPEQVQREIPPLSIGGYIYSGNKADRSVLIDKRLLHEGDEVSPGLVLEKMTPGGMVFNYKGYRYRSGYRPL